MIFDRKPSAYDEALSRLEEELRLATDADEISNLCARIDEIQAVKKNKSWLQVSPDTLVQCGVNVALALLILNYEQVNVLTSKAVRFIK